MADAVHVAHSLRRRIIVASLLIFIVSVWALSYYISRMLRDDMQRVLADQQSSIVSFVANQINHELEGRVRALEQNSRLIRQSMLDHPAALQRELESHPTLQELFNAGIVAVSRDGMAIAEVPLAAGRIGTNYSISVAIKTALTEGRAVIGRPLVGRVLQQPIFNINVPIRDDYGAVIGALLGVINLDKPNFLDRVAQHRYGKSGGYLVVDLQNRIIVTATDRSRTLTPLPAPGINEMLDRRMRGFLGSDVSINSRGVEVLSSSSRIPAADWQLVATLPTEEAFAPVRDMQRRIAVAAILLTLIVGMVSWWLLRREFAPLRDAVRSLARMSDGSKPLQALTIETHDEVGQLAGGFNQLLLTLGQREQQLKAERDFFSAVLQQSSDGVLLFDHEDLRITEVNRSICGMLGYERDELLALKYSALLDARQENVARILQDNLPLVCEWNFRKKDGAPLAVEVNASLVETNGLQLTMVNLRDLTERNRAETELRDLNRDFVSFLEYTTDFIYFKDQLGRYRFCSQTLANITGHADWRDLIGKHDREVFPADMARIYVEEDLPIFRDGKPLLNVADQYYDEFGQPGWASTNKWPVFDEDGKSVVGIFGVSRDVTQLKKSEEAYQRAQLKQARLLWRIEAVMKHAKDCIMMLDSNTRILEVSDGCVDTYGYTREELLNRRAIDLRPAQEREEASDFTRRLAQQGSMTYQSWHRRKDGSCFPIEVGAAMIDDGDECLIQVIIRDISERVLERTKLELELAAYANRLEMASRRVLEVQEEAKRRFSAELHDRTSPNLAAIRLDLAIIARLSPLEFKERAERLEDAMALIDDTEASLREICAELRPPVLDYAGLPAALEGYAQQYSRRTGIAVQVDCENCDQRLVPATESLLFRIFQEALTNCVKHAHPRSIMVALSSGADPITMTIADDGDGFDLEMLEMDGRGSGLGLLNMREMIEFSGGRFAIESQPGRGTRIEVSI